MLGERGIFCMKNESGAEIHWEAAALVAAVSCAM